MMGLCRSCGSPIGLLRDFCSDKCKADFQLKELIATQRVRIIERAHNSALQEKVNKSALDVQAGGNHYKKCKIQPIEYIQANNLDYIQGNIIKYATRYKDKGGKEDLEKIKHYCDLAIEAMEKSDAKDAGQLD